MIFTAPNTFIQRLSGDSCRLGGRAFLGGHKNHQKIEDSQKQWEQKFWNKKRLKFSCTSTHRHGQTMPGLPTKRSWSYHILPLFRSQKSQKSNVSNNRKNIPSGPAKKCSVMKPWISGDKKNKFCQTDVQIPSVPIQCYNFQETTEKNKQRRCWVVWIENQSWIRCLLFASMHHDCAPRQTLGVLEESKWIPEPHWWLRTWDSWSSLHKFRWRNAKLKASFIEIGMLSGQHAITTHWCGVNQSTHKQIQ